MCILFCILPEALEVTEKAVRWMDGWLRWQEECSVAVTEEGEGRKGKKVGLEGHILHRLIGVAVGRKEGKGRSRPSKVSQYR